MNRIAGILVALACAAPAAAWAEADDDVWVLNAVGDVAYPDGWGGIDQIDAKQEHLFDQVRPWLDTGDLNFANLECPFTYEKPTVKKTYPITCDPKRLSYVVNAGFNLFSLANNHSLDAGQKGVEDTLALMESTTTEERPLFWAGAGRTAEEAKGPRILTVPGKKVKVALFAVYNGGSGTIAGLHTAGLHDRIAAAKREADVVIVSVHAGAEYQHVPDASIVKLYHKLVDAGADVVLGHHPHVVQGVERYGQGVIFYSLGNFSFGSRTRRHHETGARLYSMIGRLTFRGGELVSARVVPLYANNGEAWRIGEQVLKPIHAVPQVLEGEFAEAALAEFQEFTAKIPNCTPTALEMAQGLGVIDLGFPEADVVMAQAGGGPPPAVARPRPSGGDPGTVPAVGVDPSKPLPPVLW